VTAAPDWDPEHDDSLLCVAVHAETHDVRTFTFAADPPRTFRFEAGQFLTFTFNADGREISRCYTIASPPTRPDRLQITSKRVPGGHLTPWLHDHLRPGMRIPVVGPTGDFCPGRAAPGAKLLLLSGGSGITPLMSFARATTDLAGGRDILFVHSARTPADIIFRAEQALLAARHPGFRPVAICEADSPGEAWPAFRGRLSLPMLRLIAPDLAEREVYCCGPAPYMAAVRAMLGEAGHDMARYHEESFDFARLAAAEPEIAAEVIAAEPAGFKVEFTKSGTTVTCGPGTFVLDAARAAGLKLPSSCTQGMCGTCKSRMISGKVDMQHQGGIRKREIDAGMVLICCSKPLTDLVIER
jgi:ferredoxin-NADP reductase